MQDSDFKSKLSTCIVLCKCLKNRAVGYQLSLVLIPAYFFYFVQPTGPKLLVVLMQGCAHFRFNFCFYFSISLLHNVIKQIDSIDSTIIESFHFLIHLSSSIFERIESTILFIPFRFCQSSLQR